MYPNFDGLGGCLIILVVLAAIGLVALAFGAYWLLTHVSIGWIA